jgi:transposase
MIVVGVDAHSQSHTAAAVDAQTALKRDVLTVLARPSGHAQLLQWAQTLERERLWALEDCRILSGALERFLLLAGERVVRVAPKLMATARKSARTYGKSDPIDAIAVAHAAIREPNLPAAQLAGPEREIRLLADHRDDLVQECTRHQRRLRRHLHEIDPDLQPPLRALSQTRTLTTLAGKLARRPQDTQVRIARELIRRIRELVRRVNDLTRHLERRVRSICPALLKLPGCGPLSAARILGDIGDITRFRTDSQFSTYCGTSPLEASSGKHTRHRLNRTGNRNLNRVLYIIAITQARIHEPAREYIARRLREGKTSREAIRALKRFIARRIHHILTTNTPTPQPAPHHRPCSLRLLLSQAFD